MNQTTTLSSSEPAAGTSLPYRPLFVLAFAAFWTVTLEMLPAGLLPQMTHDLDVRPSRVGLLVTAWAVTVALTSIPLTRASRSLGGQATLSLALAALGGSTLLTALVPHYGGVLVSRVGAAAAHGLFWSVLTAYAASIAPEGRQGRAIAVVNVGPLLASAVGLPVGTALGDLLGWRLVVGAVGVSMVVSALALRTLLPRSAAARPVGGSTEPDAGVVPVVATALLGALALLAHFAAFTFVAPLATRTWDLAESRVSGLLLVFGLAGAVGLGASGWLGDRRPGSMLVSTVLALSVVLALLALPGMSPVMTGAAVAGWGVLLGMLPPLLQTVVIGAASPAYRATAGSVLVAAFNLGIASGAAAGGLVIDHLGVERLLPIAAAAALVSAAGLTVVGKATRATEPGHPPRP